MCVGRALVLTVALVAVAVADEARAFTSRGYERHWRRRSSAPPLPHPEILHPPSVVFPSSGFVITVVKPSDGDPADATRELRRPREIAERLAECWRPPATAAGSPPEITIRAQFSRAGTIIGTARVTYMNASGAEGGRTALEASIRDALSVCAPLRFTAPLGAAIAGHPFAIRFVAGGADIYPEPKERPHG